MNYVFLSKAPFFEGIKVAEIKQVLSCLNAKEKTYQKHETIFHAGDTVQHIGLVESGSVNIIINFYWGTAQILGHIEPQDIFAENYAAIPGKELIADVVAAEPSVILFLNLKQLLTVCRSGCSFHHRLIYNLLHISAEKNLNLSTRMMHIAPKTIRDRLLSYLSEQALVHDSPHFKIPFDRQQLADYLGVDRSALSNELSKMRHDGLIAFKKNEFTLKEKSLAIRYR